MPHSILSYTLAITDITLSEFLKGNFGILIASIPFIYSGICIAIIKRDLYNLSLRQKLQELESDETELRKYQHDEEDSFWQSWSYIETPLTHPQTTTSTTLQYLTMGIFGIFILIYMRVGPNYMRKEIERYEDEFYEEEERLEIEKSPFDDQDFLSNNQNV